MAKNPTKVKTSSSGEPWLVTAGNGCLAQASTGGELLVALHFRRAMKPTKQSITLIQSLLLCILVFCAAGPILFLGGIFTDVKQLLTSGLITRGGGKITCSAVDFDPRSGGQICDGSTEYVYEPLEFITLETAIGQHFISSSKFFFGMLPIALIFGFYFYKQQNNER